MLPRRPLGKTGMEVSLLGLGTVKLGRNQGVKYPQSFKIPDDKEAAALIALAKDSGINLIDTAPAYGNSEQRLGKLLKGQRQDWLICTKVGEEFINGESLFNFTPEHTRSSVERSLRRLNSEVLDIVLIHSDGNDEAILRQHGTLNTLADLKKEGKIRAIGMSTKTVAGGLLAAELGDVVMITWNLQHDSEIPVADYCHQHDKGVLIKKALASGHSLPGQRPGSNAEPIKQCFKMIFAHPGVSSAIVGTINPQHLRANICAV
ncbi:MAG: aldo/keto reductase [Gammaproteobacteria bacterium]|nr:aldo/keto reductase [Gammaproteobacteria bacterium]MBQ0841189.1 aldo/keto reductase [Gammaproteobacteria bacterium]